MKPCCQEPSNLVAQPSDPARPDIVIRRCQVCGCRHIEVQADPGVFGIVGAKL